MRLAHALLVSLFTLPLTASLACGSATTSTTPTYGAATTKGEGWYRSIDSSLVPTVPYALGEVVKFNVVDKLTGPVNCTGANGSSSSNDSAGCSAGYGSTYCSAPTEPTDSTIESVNCEGACIAVAFPGETKGMFRVQVVGREAGRAHVVLRLREVGGGMLERAVDLSFVRADRFRVDRTFATAPHGTTYAALPGAWFTWCSALEADGKPLAYDPANVVVKIAGAVREVAVVAYPKDGARCDSFAAGPAGTIDVTFTYANLERHERVQVVDPSDVRRIEIVELGGSFDWEAGRAHIEDDPMHGAHESRSIAVGCHDASRVVQRFTTSEGVVALGAGRSLTIDPERLVERSQYDALSYDDVPIVDLIGASRGEGTITSRIGELALTLPIAVVGDCLPTEPPSDGGSSDASRDAVQDADGGP